MINIVLTESEAASIVDHVFDVPHDEEACKSAIRKLSAAVDGVTA